MARSPKNGKSGPTETVATTLLMPPAEAIKSLAKLRRSVSHRTGVINEEYTIALGKVIDKKHGDRAAISIALRLDAMPQEKLAVTWPHLWEHLKDLGIPQRATAQQMLFEESKADAAKAKAEGDGDDAVDDGKVRQIGSAARKVVERAGGTPSGSA